MSINTSNTSAVIDGSSMVVAISRTFEPCFISTSSNNLILIIWAQFSKVLYHFCHPCAMLF